MARVIRSGLEVYVDGGYKQRSGGSYKAEC